MTQHESFPGRPRGRRARPGNDVPEWTGYGSGYPPGTPGYPPPGTGQPGQPGPGQPPWQDQPWPAAQPPAPSPSVQPPSALSQPRVQPSAQPRPQPRPAQQETDWTGAADQDPMEAFSERWHRRGSDSRQERREDRRKQRRLLIAASAGLAAVIAVAVYFLVGGKTNPANPDLGSLITTFLPGEIRQVPNACASVPGATLGQYLPGQLKVAAPPLNTGTNSECTWTLDKAPLYRVLDVNIQAYSPDALVTYGDGSATFAAISAYAQDETAKQNPAPHSGQPKATITDLSGMPGGNDTDAFEADQVFNVNGATTDMATVVVRYRNVIVTVVFNGLDHANVGNYGPVSPSALASAARTIAREVTGKLVR